MVLTQTVEFDIAHQNHLIIRYPQTKRRSIEPQDPFGIQPTALYMPRATRSGVRLSPSRSGYFPNGIQCLPHRFFDGGKIDLMIVEQVCNLDQSIRILICHDRTPDSK